MPGKVTSTPPSLKLGFKGNFFNDFAGLIIFDLCEYKVNVCVSEIGFPLLSFGKSNSKDVPLGMNDFDEYNFTRPLSLSTISIKYAPVPIPAIWAVAPTPTELNVRPLDW